MEIKNRRGLKECAAQRLKQQSYSTHRLTLIHSAVAAVLLLATQAVGYALNRGIGNTGGLSGMGTRSILTTIQTVLQYATTIALPFWEMGFVFAVLSIGRGVQANQRSLTEGFRRLGPVLRLFLLRVVIFGVLALACSYLSAMVYLITPQGLEFFRMILSVTMEGGTIEQMYLMMEQNIQLILPMYGILLVLYIPAAAPLFYKFRLADFVIMDVPGTGAFRAMIRSWKLTRKNGIRLFLLDLSFWWYYLLGAATVVLSYLDLILAYLGVSLPANATVWYFVFYALALAAQVLLYTWAKGKVMTTLAVAYDILNRQTPERKMIPVQRQIPWQ